MTNLAKNRTLGKARATLLTSAMIVGVGLFASLGPATAEAQSGILIAMLIGGLIALLTGLSAAQVGVNYPVEGGAFAWTRQFGFPAISFIAGFSYLFDGIVGLSILALSFATYSAQIFTWLPIPIVASIAIITVAVINYFGILPTSKILIVVFFINLILLGLYVGFSIPKIEAINLSQLLGTSIGGVLTGAATFFWTWDGFQRTAIMADQIKEPKKTIPFAIVGGITIAAIIYLIVAGTTLGVLGSQKMGQSDTPIFLGATLTMAMLGGWIVFASAWITSFSEMLGDLLPTSKVMHAMGKEKELPQWLGGIQKRFHSPYHSLLILTIIGIVLTFFPIRKLMPIASAFTLIWYIATHFSALQLQKSKHFLPFVVTWLGIALCIGLFAFLPVWSIVTAVGILIVLTGIRWLIKSNHNSLSKN